MIRVAFANEPAHFDTRVRRRGARFLATIPTTETVDFEGHEYWREILFDLHSAYDEICAYSCHWIPADTGADTVEHFVPKSVNRNGAYEWANFRLVCSRLNSRKGAHQDVVDPFTVTQNTFHLHFPSLCVVPGTRNVRAARSTIRRLDLNDARCINVRQHYVEQYLNGHIKFTHIKTHAPFLAFELIRQNISTKAKLKRIMGR